MKLTKFFLPLRKGNFPFFRELSFLRYLPRFFQSSRFSFFPVLFSILFLVNCFEYEETIYFKKGFTGYVEITYTVPIHPKTERSVIRFLPLDQTDIEKRINKGFFSQNIKIKDYSLKYVDPILPTVWEGELVKPVFSKRARVNYKIEFSELGKLDGILMGFLFVKKRGNTISIRREFKSVLKGIDQESSSGEKKIFGETMKLLENGYLLFRVNFPQSSECRTNRGEVGLGSLVYRLPLIDTVEKVGIKSWDYSIRTVN